jgi:hypothetical protein
MTGYIDVFEYSTKTIRTLVGKFDIVMSLAASCQDGTPIIFGFLVAVVVAVVVVVVVVVGPRSIDNISYGYFIVPSRCLL